MAFQLSEKLKNMVPYESISGSYDVRLDANESFLELSDDLKSELGDVLQRISLNRYPDPLAAEVCERFAAYYGVEPDMVTAGNGSDELLNIICNAFLEPGNKLLTVLPDFSMYAFYAGLSGAETVTLKKDADLQIDVDGLIETARREQVSCVMFSNPCNPTGQGLKREQVRRILKELDCLVVLDEAYMDFYTESLLEEAGDYDNLIILRTCSKAIGLAGLRLGFAVANRTLSNVLRAVKSPYNVNTVSQAFGAVVLSHREEEQKALAQILESRDALYGALSRMQEKAGCFERVYPTVTNFVLVKTDRAQEIFEKLKTRSIVVRFMGDYLRITAGSPAENKRLLDALCDILELERTVLA